MSSVLVDMFANVRAAICAARSDVTPNGVWEHQDEMTVAWTEIDQSDGNPVLNPPYAVMVCDQGTRSPDDGTQVRMLFAMRVIYVGTASGEIDNILTAGTDIWQYLVNNGDWDTGQIWTIDGLTFGQSLACNKLFAEKGMMNRGIAIDFTYATGYMKG